VDRRKQGLRRSVAVEAGGIPLAVLPAPANRRDDGLLAATLDAVRVVGPLPAQPVVHLDAGYDRKPCRQVLTERGMVGQIAARGVPAPIQVGRRWVIERTHAWGNQSASCAGAPSGEGPWSSSGWRWPAPPSSVAGYSAAPGPTTAGRIAHVDARDACWRRAWKEAGAPGHGM
jgi:Transposase DDE domain